MNELSTPYLFGRSLCLRLVIHANQYNVTKGIHDICASIRMSSYLNDFNSDHEAIIIAVCRTIRSSKRSDLINEFRESFLAEFDNIKGGKPFIQCMEDGLNGY